MGHELLQPELGHITHPCSCRTVSPGSGPPYQLPPPRRYLSFSFLAAPRHMEFPGQGSDPSRCCDLSCRCGNARAFDPLCWARIPALTRCCLSHRTTAGAPRGPLFYPCISILPHIPRAAASAALSMSPLRRCHPRLAPAPPFPVLQCPSFIHVTARAWPSPAIDNDQDEPFPAPGQQRSWKGRHDKPINRMARQAGVTGRGPEVGTVSASGLSSVTGAAESMRPAASLRWKQTSFSLGSPVNNSVPPNSCQVPSPGPGYSAHKPMQGTDYDSHQATPVPQLLQLLTVEPGHTPGVASRCPLPKTLKKGVPAVAQWKPS